VRVGDSGRGISRGDFVGNVGVAGVSAGGLGVGVGAILRAVHGVTRLLLGDPAGSSPGAFCSNLGRLAAGMGAMCAMAPLVSGRRRT
jgi:cysteine synthase